ncbi:TIGR03750 family conjugal transfer protein [bacterium]|nr:TIGR03750 family conjugal transfer protein [bacterium]
MSDELEFFEDSAILPRRMNEATIIFMGCTLSEVTTIAVISSIFWVIFSVVLGLMLGMAMSLLAGSILLIVGTVFLVCKFLGQTKAGKPTGYLAQRIAIKMQRKGLARSHLYIEDGPLHIGRSKQYISHDRLLREDPYTDLREQSIKENIYE